MKRKLTWTTLAACAFLMGCNQETNEEQQQAASPEEVLQHWIGNWKGTDYQKPSQPGAKKESWDVELQCKWILDKQFAEETGQSAGGKFRFRYLVGYDKQNKVFRAWLFGTDGNVIQETGTWDAGTKTMTWKGEHNGLNFTTKMHFPDADTQQYTATGRDKSGKVVLEVGGTRRRLK